MIKRSFDIIISFSAALILSPLLLFISFWILIDSGLPIFYRQERLAKNKTPFNIFKFRSMKNNTEKAGFTKKNDSRITNVGKFLRKTSLDEVPQLFNVLIGDMSIVGPRPKVASQTNQYQPEDWNEVHSVKPGITGLAQINGRSSLTMDKVAAYEIEYIRHLSFKNDLKIIFKTFLKLKSEF